MSESLSFEHDVDREQNSTTPITFYHFIQYINPIPVHQAEIRVPLVFPRQAGDEE